MEANMRKKAPRKKPTISHPTPFLTLKIKVFIPVRTNRRRNTSQETTPKIPVVAKKVGISPEPTSKETSQNIDSLTAVGLCSAQSSENLFGPMPRKGLSLIDSLVIRIVEENEGLTSNADTPSNTQTRGKLTVDIKKTESRAKRARIFLIFFER